MTHQQCPECPGLDVIVQAAMNEQPTPICPNDAPSVAAAKLATDRREAATEQPASNRSSTG